MFANSIRVILILVALEIVQSGYALASVHCPRMIVSIETLRDATYTTDLRMFIGRGLFTPDRSGQTYESALGPGFIYSLRELMPGQRWLNVGSGSLVAERDYFETLCPLGCGTEVVSVDPAGHTAAAYEKLKADFPKAPIKHIAALAEELSPEEVGRFDLISDSFGALSYTPDPDYMFYIYAHLLKPGGKLYFIPGNWIINGSDGQGRHLWLSQIKGFDMIESADPHHIVLRRNNQDVYVPSLELFDIWPGLPPYFFFNRYTSTDSQIPLRMTAPTQVKAQEFDSVMKIRGHIHHRHIMGLE